MLASQAISLIGSMLVQYAMMWHITLETKSGVAMGIAMCCSFVPLIFVAGPAGVIADRYDRRIVMAVADASVAVSTLLIMLAFMFGFESLWLMYLVLALRTFGGGFQRPALNALVAQFVPPKSLIRYNGISGTIQASSEILGPALGGAVLAVAPITYIFAIDIVTAIIGIAMLLIGVKVPRHKRLSQGESFLGEFKGGIRYLLGHKMLTRIIIFYAILTFGAAGQMTLPDLRVARMFDETWRLSMLGVAFGVGMAIGGLIVAAKALFKSAVTSCTVACIVLGVCTLASGLSSNYWVIVAAMAISGLSTAFFNAPAISLIQEKTDNAQLGRVMSVFSMVAGIAVPLATMLLGFASDIVASSTTLICCGIFTLIAAVFMRADPMLRKY